MSGSPYLAAASRKAPFRLHTVRGLVVEARDASETKAFYARLFGDEGEWVEEGDELAFARDGQFVCFTPEPRPGRAGETGRHQAYVVSDLRLASVRADDLWTEDHPAERAPQKYLLDPSGNRVQLVPGTQGLIDHVVVEAHDLEMAEVFYANILGGEVDYCHGWAMDDYAEALEEDGSSAPWTRRYDVRYWDKVRIRRPNMQLFVRFGATRVGVVLALEHRQEPAPDQLRNSPRIVLASDAPEATLTGWFDSLGLPYLANSDGLFLRDPGGNFIQIELI